MSTEFVELPEGLSGTDNHSRSRVLHAFAGDLRANQFRWAKYPLELKPTILSSTASAIRAGRGKAFRDRGFEAAVRDGVLYVRFVGVS